MTTYTPIVPTISGADAGPAKPAAAADKITPAGRLMLVIENASGSPITCTLEDANTVQPAGSVPSTTFADLVITVPATDRVAVLVGNTSRFVDGSGLISLTWSATTSVTWNAFEVA